MRAQSLRTLAPVLFACLVTSCDGSTAAPANALPQLTVISPADGAEVLEGVPVPLRGSAIDAEDGSLSHGIRWSSNVDGHLGDGSELAVSLSPTVHRITAVVADSEGASAEASRTVSVQPNLPPLVAIHSPEDGSDLVEGAEVVLSASAVDPEEGDVADGIRWTSSLSGALGRGATISITLPPGSHEISAVATDSSGREGSAVVNLSVRPNGSPTVLILDPTEGAAFSEGSPVQFKGEATDPEDGVISGAIEWSSSLSGSLGGGAALSAELAPGDHRIVATVEDAYGAVGSAARTIRVLANRPPSVSVAAPSDGTSIVEGDVLDLIAEAHDPEEGDASSSIRWSSDLVGNLGAGPTISVTLPAGSHSLTAVATDTRGARGSSSVTVDVVENSPPSVEVVAPTDGSVFSDGSVVELVGNATDIQDGDLSSSIRWVSSVDGGIGSGSPIGVTLTAGTHQVEAIAVDAQGLAGSAVVELTVLGNRAPVVAINSPISLGLLPSNQPVVLSGEATDPEDGELSSSIEWTSDIDGVLGTGASLTLLLTSGQHVLSATVVDSDGASASASAAVAINSPPSISIAASNDWADIPEGESTTFSGVASDADEGDLGEAIVWTSSLSGGLGSGRAVTVTLSAGTHEISGSVSDGIGERAAAVRSITVVANRPPAVEVVSPASGSRLVPGADVDLVATASDPEEGDLASRVEWSSSIDGALGTGTGLTVNLSEGAHQITALVLDSEGLRASAVSSVLVTPDANLLTSGSVVEQEISVGGSTHEWVFDATPGQRIFSRVTQLDGTTYFWPRASIQDPNGVTVGPGNFLATMSGRYTLTMYSWDGGAGSTGRYRLQFLKAPAATAVPSGDEGGHVVSGSRPTGTIVAGDLDSWSFDASAGARVVVRLGVLSRTTRFYGIELWVVGPDGNVIEDLSRSTDGTIEFAAPSSGTYTVVVAGDYDRGLISEAGEYRIDFVATPGSFTTPSGDEGGTLARGVSHDAMLEHGELDVWTFDATAGEELRVRVEDPGSANFFYPQLWVVSPTGVLLTPSAYHHSVVERTITAPEDGTYFVIVSGRDRWREGGSYSVSLTLCGC